jgi:phage-related protein
MAAVDTLEIEIKTTLDDVTKKLDGVIQKLGIVSKELSSIRGVSNFKDISQSAKDASKSIGEMGSQLKQAGKSMNPQLKKASKSLDQIREQYKDLGKGFELKGSSDYLQKQIDSLSNSLEKANLRKKELEAAGKTGGATYENAIKNVIKYENQIDSLKKKLSSLNDGWKPQNNFPISGMVAENEKTAGSGEIFTEDTKEYQKRVASILESMPKPEVEIAVQGEEAAEGKLSLFREAINRIEDAWLAFQDKLTLKTGWKEEIDDSAGKMSLLASSVQMIKDAFESAISGIKKFASALKKIGSAAGKAFSMMKTITATVLGMQGSIFKSKSASNGLTNSFSGGIKTLLKYGLGIRSLYVLFNKLRSAIVAGMNNLVQYSSETNSSVSLLSNSMLQLKNSAAAMAAPLLNAIAPALNQIIQLCISAANAINQLISSLTGKGTWIRAKKQTNNYAAGLKKTGSSAKKAAKDIQLSVLAFDELNQLTSNKDNEDSGSGGSGGGAGGAGMFETVPIDEGISDFAQQLKDAFNNADWKTFGTLLGEKVNEAIDSVDWNGIGSKIGYWFNAAVQTAYWFLDTIDFNKIGVHFGELINGAFSEVDFSYVGAILAKKTLIIFDLIIGAIQGIDWGLVGKSISDLLKGAFDEWTKWLQGYDWADLGAQLYQKVKDLITGIDWAGLATSFYTFLGTAWGSAISLIYGFISNLWKDITAYFSSYVTNDDGTKKIGLDWVAGILKGIWDGVKNIFSWIKTNVFQPFINGFKSAFGIHSPSTVMAEQGGYIITGLLNGIKEGFGKVISWIGNCLSGIRDTIKDKWDSIKTDAKEKFSDITENISSKWKEIKENTSSTWSDIKSNLDTKWNALKSNAGSTWGNLKNTISTKWADIKSDTSSVWSGLVDNLKKSWEAMGINASSSFSDIKEKISDNIGKARDAVKDGIDRMKGFFNFHWELPKIKLPHFNISGSFSLRPPRVPSFSVDWYKTGGLFSDASVIGVGEAGSEAVLPLENRRTMSMIADSIMGNYGYGMDEDKLAEAVERGVAMALMNNQYGDRPINLYAELKTEDNEVLARAVSKGQRSINRRYNPTPQFG